MGFVGYCCCSSELAVTLSFDGLHFFLFTVSAINITPPDAVAHAFMGSLLCFKNKNSIHEFWTKFKFRSGQNIADEMIENYKTHGITDFYFMDSLINGSMKAYRELCSTLVEYYKQNNLPEKFFRWGGQFIVRSAKQMLPSTLSIIELTRK